MYIPHAYNRALRAASGASDAASNWEADLWANQAHAEEEARQVEADEYRARLVLVTVGISVATAACTMLIYVCFKIEQQAEGRLLRSALQVAQGTESITSRRAHSHLPMSSCIYLLHTRCVGVGDGGCATAEDPGAQARSSGADRESSSGHNRHSQLSDVGQTESAAEEAEAAQRAISEAAQQALGRNIRELYSPRAAALLSSLDARTAERKKAREKQNLREQTPLGRLKQALARRRAPLTPPTAAAHPVVPEMQLVSVHESNNKEKMKRPWWPLVSPRISPRCAALGSAPRLTPRRAKLATPPECAVPAFEP